MALPFLYRPGILRLGCVCMLMMHLAAHAQSVRTISNLDYLSVEDGLSQGYIFSMLQDSKGFMWFCTLDGLNRYDGYEFKVYRHQPHDPHSISGNEIHFITEDSYGNIWVFTEAGGIDLFHREQEKFIHFGPNSPPETRIQGQNIHWLCEVTPGTIYVMSDAGLERITLKRSGEKKSGSDKHNPFDTTIERVPVADADLSAQLASGIIYKLKDGSDWISSPGKIGKITWSPRFTVDWITPATLCPSFEGEKKHFGIVEDTLRNLRYFIHSGGVLRYHTKSEESNYFPSSESLVDQGVIVDASGDLWTPGWEIRLLDHESSQWQTVSSISGEDDAISKHGAFRFYMDKNGLVWIGTGGYGVYVFNPRADKFHTVLSDGMVTGSIYTITENNAGNLLVETNAGLMEFDPRQGRYLHEVGVSGQKKGAVSNLPGGRAALQDGYNNYYIVRNSDLYYMDTEKIRLDTIYRDPGESTYSPLQRDATGHYWFTSSEGLCSYDPAQKKTTAVKLPVQPNATTYKRFIQCLFIDARGKVWLGTHAGLLSYNNDSGNWTIYTTQPGDTTSLSSNLVYSICSDPSEPDRYVWIGTGGGGLNKLDLVNGRFTCINTLDGLPNDVVYGVLPDRKKRLWMSTNRGLSCFDPTTGSFINYDREDGLQGNEFNRFAYCRGRDGHLYFGGVNGLTYFLPEDLETNKKAPDIVLTDVWVLNQTTGHETSDNPLPVSPTCLTRMELEHDQNMITFRFAALDFAASYRNQYKYRLQGLSEEWIETGHRNEVNFTGLAPGVYLFTVTGCNSDGTWNEIGRSVEIIIRPPWWATWWFRILVFLLLVYLTITLMRYRIRQLRKVQLIRDRIARDLHDEIGSTLSSIAIYSDVVLEKTKDKVPEVNQVLKRISQSTQRMMESMGDIVWAINSANDSFENIMARIRSFAAEITEARGIELSIHASEKLENLKLGMEERKNIYLIFKEAINNAVKYAGATAIEITLYQSGNKASLEIKDNGVGFDIQNRKEGNGITNMIKRASMIGGTLDITSQEGSGTRILLTFPL